MDTSKYVICKYFLLVCGMSVSFSMVFFEKQKFFILIDSSLSVLSVLNHAFDVTSQKALPNTELFSSGRFTILALTWVCSSFDSGFALV